jgi:hypothetical protein
MTVSTEERRAILAGLEHGHTEYRESDLAPLPQLIGGFAASPVAVIRKPANQHIVSLPHVQSFATALLRATGADSFGTYLGHSPTPERAVDAFCPVNSTKLGDAMCSFALAHWAEFGLRYMIYRQRIHWGPGEDWEWMADRGSPTQNHMDHAHYAHEEKAAGPITPIPVPPTSEEDELFSKSPIACTYLIAAHSGLFLTSTDDKHMSGVVQKRADGSLNQRWQIVGHTDGTVSYVNRAGDLALDRPDYSTDAGTFLQVANTEYNDAQLWQYDEVAPYLGRLWAPGTNRLLDIHMASRDEGAGLQLWYGNHDWRHQQFVFATTI